MELKHKSNQVYVIIDKVKNIPAFFSLDMNDNDFIRNNWSMLSKMYQFKDIEAYCLGDSCDLINALVNKTPLSVDIHKVVFGSYQFDTESENLLKAGLKQDEIEAYFAERSKANRGITEKQIISIMENYIAQKSN